jgi:hypothetical protein
MKSGAGNRASNVAAGPDPNNLADGDVSAMTFGAGGSDLGKDCRDIRGCGQAVGAIEPIEPTAVLIECPVSEDTTAAAWPRFDSSPAYELVIVDGWPLT